MKGERNMNFILKKMMSGSKDKSVFGNLIVMDDTVVPCPDELTLTEDVPYKEIPGGQIMADIIRPKNSEGRLPIAINIHGGALVFGDHRMERTFGFELAKRGYLVYNIDYRHIDKADGFEELDDVLKGLAFVKQTAAEYGGDTDRIYVMSESAGAFLALYATAAANSSEVRRAYGCIDPGINVKALVCASGMLYVSTSFFIGLVYRKEFYGERRRDKKFMKYTDPEFSGIMNALPPVFLTTSKGDFLRRSTKKYVKALRGAGHPHRYMYFDSDELKHAFPFLLPMLPQSREVLGEIDKWIRNIV